MEGHGIFSLTDYTTFSNFYIKMNPLKTYKHGILKILHIAKKVRQYVQYVFQGVNNHKTILNKNKLMLWYSEKAFITEFLTNNNGGVFV